MTDFDGFPKETVAFLADISANNDKSWFDAHRKEYEEYWLEPAKEFVEAMGERLAEVAPDVIAEPKINGSIRRINRDTRFSKDKTPYKDHLDIGLWEGDRKNMLSGFWMRITPEAVGVGVGVHGFDKQRLARFRDAVVNPKTAASLRSAVEIVEAAGNEIHGEHYKRVPTGYEPADDLQERFIRYAALWTGEDVKQPRELHSAKFLDWLMARWEPQLPLHRWLVDELG